MKKNLFFDVLDLFIGVTDGDNDVGSPFDPAPSPIGAVSDDLTSDSDIIETGDTATGPDPFNFINELNSSVFPFFLVKSRDGGLLEGLLEDDSGDDGSTRIGPPFACEEKEDDDFFSRFILVIFQHIASRYGTTIR